MAMTDLSTGILTQKINQVVLATGDKQSVNGLSKQ